MTTVDDEWATFIRSQSQMSWGIPTLMEPARSNAKAALVPKATIVSKALPLLSETEDETESDEAEVESVIAECGKLYISTKTKVLFLNKSGIDLNALFWSVPVIEYWRPVEGVVNKQIKIESNSMEEYDELVTRLKTIAYYTETAIKQINNPSARRIKFKDQRKITVGVCKKDIMNCRGRVRKAFDNCFAIIMRYTTSANAFREIHVKIFATGKLEIPGILNDEMLQKTRDMLITVLQPYFDEPLGFLDVNPEDNVLINSNFNCGFYVNRDKLFGILREKYGVETSFDPCIYPGIKCKFYFNHELGFDEELQRGVITDADCGMKMSELNVNKKYNEVSFMIFRTGSCLIVGNCTEKVLTYVYEFIKKVLMAERDVIITASEEQQVKNKKPKQRKRMVSMTADYFRVHSA
jgi:hypothetical protein